MAFKLTFALWVILLCDVIAGDEQEIIPNKIVTRAGRPTEFECRSHDCSSPLYVWSTVSDDSLPGKVDSNRVTVTPTVENDGFIYVCTVKCGATIRQGSTRLVVFALPEQPEIKVEGPLAVGQEVKLTCEVTDVYGPDAITIQWLEGGRVMKEDEEPLDGEVRTVRSSLTVVPREEDDERNFICKATLVMEGLHGEDAQSCISSSFPLSVPLPPKNTSIFVSPSHILKEGDMLTITCATRSNPKAAISLWRKPESGGREPLVAKAASYTLENVQMEDAGVYECEAVNRFGNSTVDIKISVQVPPRNTTILVLPSAEVEEGENITISCHTIGYPRPTMTLKKMGNSASYCSSNGTFELYFLTEDDTGLYEMNITNDVGYEVQTFNITVEPRVEGQKSPPYRAEILVPIICVSALVSVALGVLYPLLKSRLTGGYQPTLSGPQAL